MNVSHVYWPSMLIHTSNLVLAPEGFCSDTEEIKNREGPGGGVYLMYVHVR